jgi:hypothetical protein
VAGKGWRVGDAGYTIFGPNLGKVSPEIIASVKKRENSAVIAAATEMQEALEELCSDKYLSDPINADRMAKAKAALAKSKQGPYAKR